MAQYLTIARPYATALFEDAKADNDELNAWSYVLQVLSYVMSQPAVVQFAFDPKVGEQKLKQILLELLGSVVKDEMSLLGQKLDNFIQLLIERKRLIAVADMLTLYDKLVATAQNITDVNWE